MRKVKILIIILIMMLALLVGCNKASEDNSKNAVEPSHSESFKVDGDALDDASTDDSIDGGGTSTNSSDTEAQEEYKEKAGQLTVSCYNDNDHFDYYKSLISSGQTENGVFYGYQKLFGLYTNRIALTFKNANDVKVTLLDDNNNACFISKTDANGLVYLYNNKEQEEYNIKVEYNKDGNLTTENFKVKNNDEIDLNIVTNTKNILQLMFVIDTTGSMGDEISYLKSEIEDVIKRVKADNENITIYLALLFYRDKGDVYVTRYFDFTTDIASQVTNLSGQSANGGGDFEEAVQDAFSLAARAQWLPYSSSNIIVHVADAPSHDEDVNAWMSSVDSLAALGVRIINVASSGVDKKTEYLFRNECIRTMGYYCYLTDDSGIGDPHIQATVENKPTVEYLNECLIRLINGIHTGDMKEAIYYKQVQ